MTKTYNSENRIDCRLIMFHPIPEISYMSTPDHRKSSTPQPSISHLRTSSRSSSRGSRSHEEYKETIQVHLICLMGWTNPIFGMVSGES